MSDIAHVEIVLPELVVENEIRLGATQRSVAMTYALAMRKIDADKVIDWKRLNAAIIAKWGERGLDRVKRRAWAYLEGRKEFGK